MDLTWTVDRDAGASFVRCRVHNDDAVRRRVRIENGLDGPVLPPRRAGVPEAGWDARGVTLRLAPDERRSIGFAVPAPPVEPPVEIVAVETVEKNGDPPDRGRSAEAEAISSAAALGDLAEHRPPRAAVTECETTADGSAGLDIDPDVSRTDDGDPGPETGENRPAPGGLDEWFDAVERRLELAERLTDADLQTATAVVEDSDGVDELAARTERVTADAERLRTVSERAASLATRAEATDAPIEALERLS